jgi:hypothetical protein
MDGEIYQLIALTSQGNAYINGNNIPQFFPNNKSTSFCHKISFFKIHKDNTDQKHEDLVATTPDEWFYYLKQNNAKGIRLLCPFKEFKDLFEYGFSSISRPNSWSLEVLLPNNLSAFWIGQWGGGTPSDKNIWNVKYFLVDTQKTQVTSTKNFQDAVNSFKDTLQAIQAFSEKHNCKPFTDIFCQARKILEEAPLDSGNDDLIFPGSLDDEVLAALRATICAWVFGGMGSWDDFYFENDNKNYHRVTKNFHSSLTELLCLAVNKTLSSRTLPVTL